MPVCATAFLQPCPVCGRSLRVPVRLLGKTAACNHCAATLVTRHLSGDRAIARDSRTTLMDRADALLAACCQRHPAGVADSTRQESPF